MKIYLDIWLHWLNCFLILKNAANLTENMHWYVMQGNNFYISIKSEK
jgi:hypothetical protein